MIRDDEELEKAVEQAGVLLQEIQDYCARKDHRWANYPKAQVEFPKRFIRTADMQRRRIPFVRDGNLKSNVAYTLILSDAILWLSIRTNLYGIPNEMLTKVYVFILGSICESLTKDYLHGIRGGGYKRRTEYLFDHRIIDGDLRDDLDWLWDTRKNMHLFRLADREYDNEYDHKCHARAVKAFRGLIGRLRDHGRIDSS